MMTKRMCFFNKGQFRLNMLQVIQHRVCSLIIKTLVLNWTGPVDDPK